MKKAEVYNSKIIEKLINEIPIEQRDRTRKRMMLAARIDDAMIAKGWKNKDLAEALNQNQSVITRWLSGTHNFTTDTLSDIERVLGIKLINVDDEHVKAAVFNIFLTQKAEKDKSYGFSTGSLLANEPVTYYKSETKN